MEELQQIIYQLPKIFVLDQARETHWDFAGRMWPRIWNFAKNHCPETSPDILVDDVKAEFVKPHPRFLIIAFRNDDYELVGHLLACISIAGWSQKRRCLILQYELDEGFPLGALDAGFDSYVVDWAKTQYCHSIIAETKTEQARRVFTTFYQFEIDIVQVTRAL